MQPPQKLPKPTSVSSLRHRLSLVVLAVVLAAFATLFVERQPAQDWLRLRTYQPPASIAKLVGDDTMTPYGRKLFYINHPQLDNKQTFVKNCPNGTEKTIVLGCYSGGENGIYLLKVDDPRLQGVEQVTAAHEMLHAAYERLSAADKKSVDAMLTDYYQHDLTDTRIKATIAAYKKSEPTELVNEMHSVFGTEIAVLPAPLERYYQRYFTNRHAVTTLAANYQAVFTSREQQLAVIDARLKQLKSEITAQEADLRSRYVAIQQQKAQLDSQKAAGQYSAYNAAVDGYNRTVAAYQQDATAAKQLIATYNELVQQHNALVVESQQLVQELQTNSVPQAL